MFIGQNNKVTVIIYILFYEDRRLTFREKIYALWIRLAFASQVKKFFLYSRGVAQLEKLIDVNESILDIGCGVGQSVDHFNKRKNYIIGIDVHIQSIKAAKEHFENSSFIVASGLCLPFKSKSFDTVILSYSLHHIPLNILSQCKEIARKRVIVIEMRNNPFLNIIDLVWDKLLPYPNYRHVLPTPDSTFNTGTNRFSIFLV